MSAPIIGAARIAVFEEVGRPIVVREVKLPDLADGEILVRVSCCTICGSDLHTASGRRPAPAPSVLGHEITGHVVSVGARPPQAAGGATLAPGDRIVWSVAACCNACERCDADLPQKCESLFKYGHERIGTGGVNAFSGGLAEYCVVKPGTTIVRVPQQLPDGVIVPAGCATATVACAMRHLGDVSGRRVLVLGAGMLGLTACCMAATRGASEVTVVDVNDERLRLAESFGATQTAQQVPDESFDCVLEMSGHPDAVESAIRSAAIGARVVLVGTVSPGPAVSFDPEQVVRRLVSIHGVHNYHPRDLITAVEFLRDYSGQYPFQDLVQRTFSLADVNEAFEYARNHHPIRVAILP